MTRVYMYVCTLVNDETMILNYNFPRSNGRDIATRECGAKTRVCIYTRHTDDPRGITAAVLKSNLEMASYLMEARSNKASVYSYTTGENGDYICDNEE